MKKRWTMQDIERLKSKGVKVVETRIAKPAARMAYEGAVNNEPAAIQFVKRMLTDMRIEFITEYRFSKTRKFRFDIAIPEIMVAIEYEGVMSEKSRHTTIAGYTRDCVKYNLAQVLGWKVLRYTASNYDDFEHDIKSIINGKEKTKNS